MSLVNYSNLNLLLVQILFICYIWLCFLSINSKKSTNDLYSSKITNKIKIKVNECFSHSYIFVIKLYMVYFVIFHGRNEIILFNHFNFNNFSFMNSILFLLVSYSFFFLLKSIKNNHLNKSMDYYFAINNILICTPFIFYVNTVFTFLFTLEVISILILYKLISSKIWFFKTNSIKNNKSPQQYVNMLFFQFWVTFFSTIFIVYFYINVFFIFGSSEWFLIQFLNVSGYTDIYKYNVKLINFLVSIFIFSVFFKLGVSPVHLFKLEVYKGIPYLSIFFYTIYFLTIFLYFTVILLVDLLINFNDLVYIFLAAILFFGIIYVVILIFDINFLKVFFTYSTIINTIGFMITTIALF